jgi:hypothetical protein
MSIEKRLKYFEEIGFPIIVVQLEYFQVGKLKRKLIQKKTFGEFELPLHSFCFVSRKL